MLCCTSCGKTFSTQQERKTHKRTAHQAKVVIQFPGLSCDTLIRNEKGQFVCQCGKEYHLPRSIQKHARGCTGTGQQGVNVHAVGMSSEVDAALEPGDDWEEEEMLWHLAAELEAVSGSVLLFPPLRSHNPNPNPMTYTLTHLTIKATP